MTFEQAKKELKKLVKGNQYFAISYEYSQFSDGEEKQECALYTEKSGWRKGETWEIAFEKLSSRKVKRIIQRGPVKEVAHE